MLNLKSYFIKEHVGKMIAQAMEQASPLRKLLKLVVNKRMLPFHVDITDTEGNDILSIQRGFTFLRSKVYVRDAKGEPLGYFRQRLLSFGGRFDIFNAEDDKVAELKGNLIGWNFKFLDVNGEELGEVTKKWAGIGKELFTSADNYIVTLKEGTNAIAMGPLLLCAALCVDMVLKE